MLASAFPTERLNLEVQIMSDVVTVENTEMQIKEVRFI